MRPEGFTGPGFRQFYAWILPGLGGAEKKAFFNDLSLGIVLSAGLFGAAIGLGLLGWAGAILGLGGGIAAGGSLAESQRFHRE